MMSDLVDVFLHILINEPTDSGTSKRIMKSLDKYGIKEKYFTPGTNHIRAFAKWEESEISEKAAEIKKISDVREVLTRILVPI